MSTNFRVLNLRPAAQPLEEQALADAGRPLTPAAPLVDALRVQLSAALGEILRGFFAASMDALGAQARHNRTALELAGWLSMEQARLTRTLAHDLGRRITGADAEEHGRRAFSIDDAIALANLEVRLESLHGQRATEVQRELTRLQREMAICLNPVALAPASLCAWLQTTIENAELPPVLRQTLYELFDRFAAPPLGQLYTAALSALSASGGVLPAAPTAPPEDRLDAATIKALRMLARPHAGIYDNGALASDLLAIAVGRAPEGFPAEKLWRPLQRIVLVGRMLNEVLVDPYLPGTLKPLFEALRFPLIKAVLSDGTFFVKSNHPVRSLVNELASMSVVARISGDPALKQMEQVLHQVRSQFDLNPAFVRNALVDATAVADVHGFIEQQEGHTRNRRECLVAKARRTVSDEVHLHTLGRELSPAIQVFVDQAWAPLMTRRLLRHGLDGAPWRSASLRLEQVLGSLAARGGGAPPAVFGQLIDIVGAELMAEGFGEHKVAEMRAALLAAWQAPPGVAAAEMTPAASKPAATVAAALPTTTAGGPAPLATHVDLSGNAPLAEVLIPGGWFRVLDSERGAPRWLKLTAYYPRLNSVVFTEFDGERSVRMAADRLAEDLAQGRSEPVNPTAEVRAALRRLVDARPRLRPVA